MWTVTEILDFSSVFGVGIFFLIAPFPDLCLSFPYKGNSSEENTCIYI